MEERYKGVIKEELKSVFYTLKRKITDESDKEMLYDALFELIKDEKPNEFDDLEWGLVIEVIAEILLDDIKNK